MKESLEKLSRKFYISRRAENPVLYKVSEKKESGKGIQVLFLICHRQYFDMKKLNLKMICNEGNEFNGRQKKISI